MSLTDEYVPSPSKRARDHVELFERSGGTQGNTMHGLPVIVLTSVGAKSGKVRKTPLMRVEHDGRYAVVASQGGAPTHPLWYHNLRAHPEVELQDGAVKRRYLAHEAEGEERGQWWQRAVDAFPNYAEYQTRTARQIPVLVLEPVD
jgi:F420H(2)-dependent quinone reductase